MAGGQTLVRELYPVNSFRSQMPSLVHFGLGEATRVDRLTIRWPSGSEQQLTDLAADCHIVVDEAGEGAGSCHHRDTRPDHQALIPFVSAWLDRRRAEWRRLTVN